MQLGAWLIAKAGSKQAMVDAASANAMKHSQEIERHVQEVWDVFFKMNQPVACGKALANVAYWALGPANTNMAATY